MRTIGLLLLMTVWSGEVRAGADGPGQASLPAQAGPKDQVTSNAAQKEVLPQDAGYLEPAQAKDLLHRVWLAEFRINDLLTQVHPERWKVSDAGRASFQKTLETLRKELAALEEWRAELETRSDSIYLGYETYSAINAVLPRLDGVARAIGEHENTSLAAQYTEVGTRLFDLQQTFQPYLGYLLRNQDQVFLTVQTNLAGCEKQLGVAMQGAAGRVKVIGSARPVRPRTRRSRAVRSKSKRGQVKSAR